MFADCALTLARPNWFRLSGRPRAPAMIFDIFQVLWDKCIFSAFHRWMGAAPQNITSLSGCYVLWSTWRPKPENTTKIGQFRINGHNHFSRHVISEIQTTAPIFSTTPDSDLPLTTWLRGRLTSVVSTSGLYRRQFAFPMSVDVGPCRQCHGWVGHHGKHGVAAGMASLSRPSQELFLVPVWRPPFWI